MYAISEGTNEGGGGLFPMRGGGKRSTKIKQIDNSKQVPMPEFTEVINSGMDIVRSSMGDSILSSENLSI